jgi:hypothetical protein
MLTFNGNELPESFEKVGKKKAGRILDREEILQLPTKLR